MSGYTARGLARPACFEIFKDARCAVIQHRQPDVTYWIVDGRVALIRTEDPMAATGPGVRLGQTVAEVRALIRNDTKRNFPPEALKMR